MNHNRPSRKPNPALFLASAFAAIAGVLLTAAGVIGTGAGTASAGDEDPLPIGTVVTQEVPPSSTSVPPTNTSVPPTNTSVPPTNTSVPPTNTSVPPTNTPPPGTTNTPVTLLAVTPTSVPAATATAQALLQTVAGVRALPGTGDGGGSGPAWLMVFAGIAMSSGGVLSLALQRRRHQR